MGLWLVWALVEILSLVHAGVFQRRQLLSLLNHRPTLPHSHNSPLPLRIDGPPPQSKTTISIPDFAVIAAVLGVHAQQLSTKLCMPVTNVSPPTYHQCLTNVSPMSHQCLTNVSPMHHQCITNVSPMHHQCITNVSPMHHHQRITTNVSPPMYHHQCITNASPPMHHQRITNVSPMSH